MTPESPFPARAARAELLRARWSFADELLGFLGPVFELQADGFSRARAGQDLLATARALLAHAERGPPTLAARARVLRPRDLAPATTWQLPAGPQAPDDFFRLVLHQVAAVARRHGPAPHAGTDRCPWCGGPPVVSLRIDDPEARAVRRSLVCGACAGRWSFPRVCCPVCREERPDQLPRLAMATVHPVTLEACRTCSTALKSVDLVAEPEAEGVVEELAALPLDLVARENGWRRVGMNLAGT